jgi:hypothetical protein
MCFIGRLQPKLIESPRYLMESDRPWNHAAQFLIYWSVRAKVESCM